MLTRIYDIKKNIDEGKSKKHISKRICSCFHD